MPYKSREIRLARRPVGFPTEDDFALAETSVPEPSEGQLVVRNLFMSVDPYMRGRMNDVRSYVPPYQIGQPLDGAAIGRVEASEHPGFPEGTHVVSIAGWRERFLSDGGGLRALDRTQAPLTAHLGALGMPGLTAYVGILDVGAAKAGETVFVSAAAGAVGTVAGQIARIVGCTVVGSAGSEAKVAFLRDLGFDSAFNYRKTDPGRALAELAPRGIDVYFDNVGGRHLEAAIDRMRVFGRIAVCGMISQYNETRLPPGPRGLIQLIPKRITMRGFITSDHLDRLDAFQKDMTGWIGDGRVQIRETIVDGIDRAPEAFLGMLRGENLGKMMVRLAPDA